MYKVNYECARKDAGFRWYVNASHYTLFDLTGITIKEYNLNPVVGVELFSKKNRKLIVEIFGEEVVLPGVATPSISYGHINGLGFDLVFPEGGEVNYKQKEKSLDEYIDILQSDIDFSINGHAPFYIDYRDKLKEAYPDEKIGFGYSCEGPLTTAYELRENNVFYDFYDQPEKLKEFLKHLTYSIIKFRQFQARVCGLPEFKTEGYGLYDDVAAMLSPSMWEEFVLPYWELYYSELTNGRRMVHCEDLTALHMPFLENACIIDYDPSISHKINPKIIRDGTRVPFRWRMGSFHFPNLTVEEVRDWVFQAVADGASCVFTIIESNMTDDLTIEKVKTFIESCKLAETMIDEGLTREQIGCCVSEKGRTKFWEYWPR